MELVELSVVELGGRIAALTVIEPVTTPTTLILEVSMIPNRAARLLIKLVIGASEAKNSSSVIAKLAVN